MLQQYLNEFNMCACNGKVQWCPSMSLLCLKVGFVREQGSHALELRSEAPNYCSHFVR